MVCLGFEPLAAGWKAQTNPLTAAPLGLLFIETSVANLINILRS